MCFKSQQKSGGPRIVDYAWARTTYFIGDYYNRLLTRKP